MNFCTSRASFHRTKIPERTGVASHKCSVQNQEQNFCVDVLQFVKLCPTHPWVIGPRSSLFLAQFIQLTSRGEELLRPVLMRQFSCAFLCTAIFQLWTAKLFRSTIWKVPWCTRSQLLHLSVEFLRGRKWYSCSRNFWTGIASPASYPLHPSPLVPDPISPISWIPCPGTHPLDPAPLCPTPCIKPPAFCFLDPTHWIPPLDLSLSTLPWNSFPCILPPAFCTPTRSQPLDPNPV